MPYMLIGITEPENFSPKALKDLKTLGTVHLYKNENKIIDFVADKDVIFVRLKRYWDKSLIPEYSKLKYVCSPTTGLNHLDLPFLKRHHITVLSLKNERKFLSNIRATPEHTLGLIIALLRKYNHSFLSKSNSNWNRDKYRGEEIYGRNIGIVGFGRVGKLLGKYLHALGANTYFYDTNVNIKTSFCVTRIESLSDLFKTCSIIVLCAAHTDTNSKFINKEYIDLLKDKYFVNTARGELIDEDYLLRKISDHHFKGVALDVIANETQNNNLNAFINLTKNANLILTPHIGGCTYESMQKTEEFLVNKLISNCKKN